ncbi:hypothetical protein YC2023_071954 [Brassica napus]
MVDSEDRYSTEKASSVQSAILYDCDAEALSNSIRPGQSYSVMVKWRCCPELVQIHGFRSVEVLLDIPLGKPKNCPEARGGSVRVQISPSRPVSVFMIKPRVCPSRGQFSPVQSRRLLGFGQVLSDQPAASRLEHCELGWYCSGDLRPYRPISFRVEFSNTNPMPYRLDYEYWWVISVSLASYSAGSRKPLIRWIGKTQRDGIMAYG